MPIQTDRALIPAQAPAVRYLTITVTAPGLPARLHQRPAVNVSLVLDRSGSMDGTKIAMARQAVAHAVRLLHDRDRLSLIVFDDDIDTILEATPASTEAKQNAIGRLAAIDARGSTNLSGGWFAGVDQIKSAPAGDFVNRVVLLTDGHANQGIVHHDELAAAAARFRADGVTTSALGVGAGFDEGLLSRVTTEGGGHFYFIETAAQIPDLLASELGEALEVVARDVTLDLLCDAGVQPTVLNGFPVQTDGSRVRVRLGDLVADEEITLTVAVSCAAQPSGTTVVLDCRVSDRGGILLPDPMRVEWRTASADEDSSQPVNEAVLIATATLLADRARVHALAANRQGDFNAAARIVRDAVAHLQTLLPENAAIASLIKALEREHDDLIHPMPALMLKARHFAAHAAVHSRSEMGKARRKR